MDQWNDCESGGGYFDGSDVNTPTHSTISPNLRQQFLCPVTVRQVLEAPEQGLKIGSLTATMVSLCGVVSNVEIASTTIKFCLSDDTGVIDCLEWIESQNVTKAQTSATLKESKYYHVYGCIKFPQGRRRIMVFKVVPVKDIHEITAFMLEVLSAQEYSEKMKKEPNKLSVNAFDQNSFNSYNSSMHNDKNKLTSIQRALLEAISAVQNPLGWSRLESDLSKRYSEREMQENLDKLVCEGHIYTTIDDDHFCCT